MNKIINKQEELIEVYKQHVKLLGEEIHDLVGFLYSHGWKSNRYEQGKINREKIEKLSKEIENLKIVEKKDIN